MCATLYTGRPQQPDDIREAISLTRSFLYFKTTEDPLDCHLDLTFEPGLLSALGRF